jgi:hypothetical protein
MACDSTYYRAAAIPLAYFRMIRDERQRRVAAQERGLEGAGEEGGHELTMQPGDATPRCRSGSGPSRKCVCGGRRKANAL